MFNRFLMLSFVIHFHKKWKTKYSQFGHHKSTVSKTADVC